MEALPLPRVLEDWRRLTAWRSAMGWFRRMAGNLRAGRNADLCVPAAADGEHAGARVSAQHDLEESVCQCGCAAERRVQAAEAGGFRDWRLVVDGTVAHPLCFRSPISRAARMRSQITEVACEEGWSYIAEWIGTPLSGFCARRACCRRRGTLCTTRLRRHVGQHRYGARRWIRTLC